MKLTSAQIAVFKNHKPVFMRAQEATGVPWEAVAAVWYRESFSVTPPKTPGGPYQFDPIPQPGKLAWLLDNFTSKLTEKEKHDLIIRGVNDFSAGAIFCAAHLRSATRYLITVLATDEAIKDALYGYNGRAYSSCERSPYVMNNYDEHHKDMTISGSIPDGKGGRKWISTTDKKLGAFAVFKQLRDLNV